ncbi:MAG: hypothetical protein JO270_13735 [Acidobacteriaceae bacterium]|nr:hypothetical protein [Acidobacteriaceae bacterium]
MSAAFSQLQLPGGFESDSLSNTYNVRGELIDSQYLPDTAQQFSHTRALADSGLLRDVSVSSAGLDSSYTEELDFTNGLRYASATTSEGGQGCNGVLYPSGQNSTAQFDASGRQISVKAVRNTFIARPTGGGCGVAKSTKVTSSYGFDAQDHMVYQATATITTTTDTGSNGTSTATSGGGGAFAGWGPAGHPILISGSASGPGVTLHWDEGVILFVTDATGNVVDFKAGLDGDIAPHDASYPGLNSYDRDAAGVIIQTSNTTGHSSLTPLNPTDGNAPYVPGTSAFTTPSISFQYVRPDGFRWGNVAINGARAFDSSLGAWTTPDAFEGDVGDPASQLPYMWLRNNPYKYADPSGFFTDASGVSDGFQPPLLVGEGGDPLGGHLIFPPDGGKSVRDGLARFLRWLLGQLPPPCSCSGSGDDSITSGSGDSVNPKFDPANPGKFNQIGGDIVGWGKGQSEEAVEVTREATRTLTYDKVRLMVGEHGLPRAWVEYIARQYQDGIVRGLAKENTQIEARLEYMQKILELW